MSNYTFTFKKDDIVVDFITTDKEVVEKQFRIWVDAATEYAQTHPAKPKIQTVAKASSEEKPAEAAPIVKPVEPKSEKIEEVVPETAQVFEKASSLLKTINSIQDSVVTEDVKVVEPSRPIVDFDKVLEKTIENPTFEPARVKDQVFLNLINSKNTLDKFHYLMITAYYLSEFEKLERFSLKQINAKLMHNMSEVIDHSMLQEAINQGFIELVPDLTGASEVGEYRLTPAGEEFFANRI